MSEVIEPQVTDDDRARWVRFATNSQTLFSTMIKLGISKIDVSYSFLPCKTIHTFPNVGGFSIKFDNFKETDFYHNVLETYSCDFSTVAIIEKNPSLIVQEEGIPLKDLAEFVGIAWLAYYSRNSWRSVTTLMKLSSTFEIDEDMAKCMIIHIENDLYEKTHGPHPFIRYNFDDIIRPDAAILADGLIDLAPRT